MLTNDTDPDPNAGDKLRVTLVNGNHGAGETVTGTYQGAEEVSRSALRIASSP